MVISGPHKPVYPDAGWHPWELPQILSFNLHLSLQLFTCVKLSLGVSSKLFAQMFSGVLTSFSCLLKEMVFQASSDWPGQIADFEFIFLQIRALQIPAISVLSALEFLGKSQWLNLFVMILVYQIRTVMTRESTHRQRNGRI